MMSFKSCPIVQEKEEIKKIKWKGKPGEVLRISYISFILHVAHLLQDRESVMTVCAQKETVWKRILKKL